MRDSGYVVRGEGCGLRDSGCVVRGTGYGLRGAGCVVRGAWCGLRGAGYSIAECGFWIDARVFSDFILLLYF